MNIRFDSLDRYETPSLALCNPGSKYVDGQLTKIIGYINDFSDLECVYNFNSVSEVNFRAYKYNHDNDFINNEVKSMYDSIKNRRMIYITDIGYFVITDINVGYSDGIEYKDVTASSCEVELQQKIIPYIPDKTYRFIELFETIVAVTSKWTIGYIAPGIENKFRTFEDVDTSINCLSFLIDNMQDAYECIFIFDTINRVINVYDQNDYAKTTDILLTREDLINSSSVDESSEDIYTALTVIGDSDEVFIAPINPTGDNTIYDFSYYYDWMTPELKEKVIDWDYNVKSHLSSYYEMNLEYYTVLERVSNFNQELNAIDTRIAMYERCKDNLVASGNVQLVPEYNKVILESGGTIIDISENVEQMISDIAGYISEEHNARASVISQMGSSVERAEELEDDIAEINALCSIGNYFTYEEYEELQNFIYQGAYKDEYVTFASSMSYAERFSQMKVLYDRAVTNLEKASKPACKYDFDIENFAFIKDFEYWGRQLETGSIIDIDLGDDDIAQLFLSNITVNYEDGSLNLTFGNRFDKFDPKSLFEDVLGSVTKSANTLNYVKDLLYPIKRGEISELQRLMQSSRNITMGTALVADSQNVIIDGSGITTKRKLDDGTYSPNQLKITGEDIVFTDDNWGSSKLAIGKMDINGEEVYGVNAETLYGDLILGDTLRVENLSADLIKAGTIEAEVTAKNFNMEGGTINISTSDESSDIIELNKTDGVAPYAYVTKTRYTAGGLYSEYHAPDNKDRFGHGDEYCEVSAGGFTAHRNWSDSTYAGIKNGNIETSYFSHGFSIDNMLKTNTRGIVLLRTDTDPDSPDSSPSLEWYARSSDMVQYPSLHMTFYGTITQSSDKNLKHDIKPIDNIDDLLKLNPVTFKFNGSDEIQYGFIAQEVLDTDFADGLVSVGNSGLYSLNYNGFSALLVKGYQEQSKKIKALEERIKQLEGGDEE